MKNTTKSFLALFLGAAIAAAASLPAQAAEMPVTNGPAAVSALPDSAEAIPELTKEVIGLAYRELLDSDAPRTESISSDGTRQTTFSLPTGATMTFVADKPPMSRLGGGADPKWGLYVEFNRTDQGVLASGGGAALGIALCAIPGVGWALCAVVAGVTTAATAAVIAHGLCKNILRIYAQLLGNPECR
ncbi:hypothetical protein ACPPVQ_12390 [Diaminobutyricibacter sp. McL0618]|uniref:hypothetical protein n=1 Tax=Leifsonia sp. McL0618 TaxID=3415677 RepID=UPI003CF06DF5